MASVRAGTTGSRHARPQSVEPTEANGAAVLKLGPFQLHAPAGRGAMAEVWKATHPAQGVPVAIKVVTAPVGKRQMFRSWFAHELRAVARLDHPAVVRIYDHGEIPKAVAEASDGRLPAGAPYLAMEWIPDGSVSTHAGRLAWPAIRWVLMGLLDALGHAHARGVIHRDLKPDNIMFAERGPVLTDFGVAFTAERAGDGQDEAFAGTPNYMAPEQVTGDLRALGPWSDLYAVGCLAYTLVRGRAPFDGPDAGQVARAQLLTPPPPLADGLPVPPGFARWVKRMLAKRPADRYRFAADAAVALMALSDDAPLPSTKHTSSLPHIDPSEADRTVVAPPVFLSTPAESWAAGPDVLGRPPFPVDWHRPTPPPTPPPLLGVGRALFGLRPPSLRGRLAERDALWALLRSVAEGNGARAAIIEGPDGRGKGRLAIWLAERAHELGVAEVLTASHDSAEGPSHGLGPMLARWARAEGLDPKGRRRHLGRALGNTVDAGLLDALTALTAPGGSWAEHGVGVSLSVAAERNAVVGQALALIARRRPVIVCLESLHWAPDTLAFIDQVLSMNSDAAIFLLGTVRVDGLVEGGTVLRRLDRLAHRHRVMRIALPPLDRDTVVAELQGRLPLAPALADRIADRVGGNPAFAEALVEHWLHVGALEDGAEGFRLKASHRGLLPAGLRTLLDERLALVLADRDEAWPSLEIAAALGHPIAQDEWQAACREAGVEPTPDDALDDLLDDGLMARTAAGHWSFVHPLVRISLIDRAVGGGRSTRWHGAIARLLIESGAPPARRAHHLMAAQAWAEALDPLRAAAEQALERKQVAAAHRALVARGRSLRALRRRSSDPEWTITRVLWARMCRADGRSAVAVRHAAHAAECARRIGDNRLLAQALIEHGRALGHAEGPARGLKLVMLAAHRAAAVGDAGLEARARLVEGGMRLASGEAERARGAYELALGLLRDRDETLMEANVVAALADVARREGQHDRARKLATRAGEIYATAGSRWGRAHAENLLGDITRFQGDLMAAENHYRQSGLLYGGVSSFDGLAAEGNLALVLMETARFAEARRLLVGVVERAQQLGSLGLSLVFRACLLPCLASDEDWAEWDATMAAIQPLRRGEIIEPDVARTARRGARIASSVGWPERARQAWDLTIVQLDALGRDTRSARAARDRLDAARPPETP